MMIKIALDAGHGIHTAGKRTPDGEREWTINDKVLRAAEAKLNKYQNVQLLRLDDPTGKMDVPLKTRTDKANEWGADALASIHHNALAGRWGSHGGVETYVQQGASKASFDIAAIIQPKIVEEMGLRDRGIKQANLHMTRESNMPAILTEGGFMDSLTDISSLRSEAKLKSQGEAIADGMAAYYKLKPKKASEDVPSRDVAAVPVGRPVGSTHQDAWGWAKEKGFMNGERPHELLTRQQFVTVLKRIFIKLFQD